MTPNMTNRMATLSIALLMRDSQATCGCAQLIKLTMWAHNFWLHFGLCSGVLAFAFLFVAVAGRTFLGITKRENGHRIVLANNSIVLRLNHSKLTHFRRRQRHINYDSDVHGPHGSAARPELWAGTGATTCLRVSFFCFFFAQVEYPAGNLDWKFWID